MSRMKQVLLAVLVVAGLICAFAKPVMANATAGSNSRDDFQERWPSVGEGAGYMRFEDLGVQEGLSDNSVLAIFQDSLGYLWFGTQEGLNRYDGYEFVVYKADPNRPDTLTDAQITALAETEDGTLWVGTHFGGLNRFDRSSKTFKAYQHDPSDPASLLDNHVTSLLVDSQGILWVGTRQGLSLFDPDSQGFSHFQQDAGDPRSLSSNTILSLYEDIDGAVWVGTDVGLNRMSRDKTQFTCFLTNLGSDLGTIKSITGDAEDGLWLGTQDGLIHFIHGDHTYHIYRHDEENNNSISSNQIEVVSLDREGALWIGFENHGVDLVTDFDNDTLSVIHFSHQTYDPDSLTHDGVRVIFQDQGGLMWFGTDGGGVNKANPDTRVFGFYQNEPGNINSPGGDNITALVFDTHSQSLWIGTGTSGLDRMDLTTGSFVHYQHIPGDGYSLDDNKVILLHISPEGTLYVSTQDGGLEYYDPVIDGFLSALPAVWEGEIRSRITAVSHDPSGALWVSQSTGELLRLDQDRDVIVRYDLNLSAPSGLGEDVITDIYIKDEVVWLGTENHGLVKFEPETSAFTILSAEGTDKSPSHNSITHIYEDDSGAFWLGTAGGGLNRYDPETGEFIYITTQNGLPSNRVFGILEDDLGGLWLSTGNGLARYVPEEGTVTAYGVKDGLQGNTFNRNAFTKSNNGALYFGGVYGFNAFYPQEIKSNQHVPPLVITEVSLFNQVLAADINDCSAVLSLTHDQNFLSFEFAALDYADPEQNQYAYRMTGLDDDFVYADGKRHADYPNLAWGEYTFQVIGANSDGIWNNQQVCLTIEIQPPFWGTWWFVGLLGILLAASVVIGYRWRVHRIEQQRQSLVLDVFERTEEIERRRQIASGLNEVVRLLNTNQPLEKSLDFIVKQSIGLTVASKAVIFERVGDFVEVRACYPDEETYPLNLNAPGSSSARCLLESTFLNRLLILSRLDPDTMKSDTKWEMVSGEYRTLLCTPLVVEDVVYGGLGLYYGEDRTFTPEEISLAHSLADQASLAIANQQLREKAEESAVSAERNRLARDLHDAVTQTLFSTSLIAEVLPKIWERDPEQGKNRLDELRQLTRGALGEMRTLLMELRPSALDDADPVQLFKHLTDAFTGRTGVPVTFQMDTEAECEIPGGVKHVFYRIAQEGLNNIFKHADASHVWLRFSCTPEALSLTISDDGRGFDQQDGSGGHFGLRFMQERAESIGADLTMISQTGEGTTLRLVWRTE